MGVRQPSRAFVRFFFLFLVYLLVPTVSKSNLIYFFQCRQCENRFVGRTLQQLGARIRQHVPLSFVPLDARDCRPRRGRPPKCAVQPISGSSSSREDVTACPSSFACVGHGPAENSRKDGERPTRKPPKLTKDLSASGRVTRSQVKIQIGEDERTTTTYIYFYFILFVFDIELNFFLQILFLFHFTFFVRVGFNYSLY